MSLTVIVGAQVGDEGKGKITDLEVSRGNYKYVVRYGGGNNAGHTIINDRGEFKLHILPSGILSPEIINIIGAGTVVDIFVLNEELNDLHIAGINDYSLLISSKAHLVMPWHRAMDGIEEEIRSDEKRIGTTQRGMGPVRADKAARRGLRAGDLKDLSVFSKRFRDSYEYSKNIAINVYGYDEKVFLNKISFMYGFEENFFNVDGLLSKYLEISSGIVPFIQKTELMLRNSILQGSDVLFEGAQGVLLDIDHGTYPYVTSSPCSVADIFQGAGIPFNIVPTEEVRVVGIVKAYSTRIGAGPFPTFTEGDFDDLVREAGKEFGATTGRPRMCAPIDLPMLKYAADLHGFTEIVITKLDVLSCLKDSIPVGYGYNCLTAEGLGCTHEECGLAGAKAKIDSIPAWGSDITEAKSREDLPKEAQDYIDLIESVLKVPVKYISVGPKRDQTIIC